MTVFIYQIRRKIELTLAGDTGLVNWNLPMDSNDFKVFKDLTNTIEFQVRNTDRKPVSLVGRTAMVTFHDQRTGEVMWRCPLTPTNDARGLHHLVIPPDVTADWYLGSYSYSVTVQDQAGVVQMFYVDQHQTPSGFFELCQGPLFDPQPSVEVLASQLTPVQQGVDEDLHYLLTSALPGAMKRNNFTGTHTVQVYWDNFSGELTVQGSVEEGVPAESDWYDVETRTYDHLTGTDGWSFQANLQWVRFRIHNRYSDVDGQTVLDANRGDLVRLVFRS